ncbi:MAG: hypothetical protein V1774_07095 [Candidatus Eisenbacteria bacterium]
MSIQTPSAGASAAIAVAYERTVRPGASHRRARLCAVALLAAFCFCGGTRVLAQARFARISAGMAYGGGGLFNDEYILNIKQSTSVGKFSSGLYAFDVCYVTPSRLTVGVRAHMMRVPLGNGTAVGRLDIVPATLFLAYRQPSIEKRLGGFFGAGIGVASVHFTPAATIDQWQPWEGEAEIRASDESPMVYEVFAGTDVAVAEDFSLELSLASTFIDSQVTYDPVPVMGFSAEHGYRVQARHISFAIGLRWWVELW